MNILETAEPINNACHRKAETISATKIWNACLYIRLSKSDDKPFDRMHFESTGIQSNCKPVESDSVANQRKIIDAFLAQHPEIVAVSEQVDDGFSGIIFDRPAFRAMLRDIESGAVNCVITKDLSRLGREYIETGRYLRRVFPSYGVRFVAVVDGVDTLRDDTDGLLISLKTIINDAYCHDISVKTRSALDVKRAEGAYVGACPVYGYMRDSGNRSRLAVDAYPAQIVRGIFYMKLAGMSAAAIAETLNQRGVLSPLMYKKANGLPHSTGGFADRGCARWSATTVLRILTDETYTGTLAQGKSGTPNYKLRQRIQKPPYMWRRVANAHVAVVAPYLFALTQRLLGLDTRAAPDAECVYPYAGLLVCGVCGAAMTRKTTRRGERTYHYYRCSSGKRNGCTATGLLSETGLAACVGDAIPKWAVTATPVVPARVVVVCLIARIAIVGKAMIAIYFNCPWSE